MTYILYIMIAIAVYRVAVILLRIIKGKLEDRERLTESRYFNRVRK
jgi:hypothetical protein